MAADAPVPPPPAPAAAMAEAVAAVHAVLTAAAEERRLVTYDALVAAISAAAGAGLAETLRSRMADVLRAVSIESDNGGRGLLTAIVVRDDTGLPGRGFFRLAAGRGRVVTDEHAAWAAEVGRVFAAHAR